MKARYLNFVIFFLFLFESSLQSQWFDKSNGLQKEFDYAYAIDAIDSSNAIISYSSGIYKTIDGGKNWIKVNFDSKTNGNASDIEIVTKENFWLCTEKGKIFFTENSGIDWNDQYTDITKTKYMNYIEMFDLSNGIAMGDALDRENDPVVFLKTTDGGNTWSSINDSAFGGISGDAWRRVDFINTDVGFFLESGKNPQELYKTLDGCETWKNINTTGAITNLKLFNKDIGMLYEINEKVIQRTFDGGTTWNSFIIDSAGWGNDFEFLPNDPAIVWFTDYKNLFFSNDTGHTWTKKIMPKDTLGGRDIVFTDKNNGWLLCNSGYVYRTSNNGGMITEVEKEGLNNLPTEFGLKQNYPNPFNPTTIIKYSIPAMDTKFASSTNVKLTIYDILGKEIATLVSEEKVSGNYSVEFNAKNLSSGIYYYQLKMKNFVETRKMVLLR